MIADFRYKRSEERKVLDEAMKLLLPMCYQRCTQLLTDLSEASNLLQKQILKIYYAFIQVLLEQNVVCCKKKCESYVYVVDKGRIINNLISSSEPLKQFFFQQS